MEARKVASHADIEALAPHLVGEIIASELHVSPRPRPRHGLAALGASADLHGYFQRGKNGPGGWVFLPEPELHLGEEVLVPDIAGWRRERLPALPQGAGVEVVPDWCCEVVSPSTARLDRGPKADAYARHGLEWLWLIDPVERLIEVFHLENARWVRILAHVGEEPARLPPFDAVELEVAAWWQVDPQARE